MVAYSNLFCVCVCVGFAVQEGSIHIIECISLIIKCLLLLMHGVTMRIKNGTEYSETSVYKIQTPGNHPKERIQQL
jgi:hypothetical protein